MTLPRRGAASPIRFGVVGLGRGELFASLLARHDRATLAAVCDLDPGRAAHGLEGVARTTHFDELLRQDLDAVIIGTPLPLHAAQSIAAMRRGLHVLCEVPAAGTLEECAAVVRTVEETGVKYMLAENVCYGDLCLEWKGLIDAGAIGKLVYAEAEYVHDVRDLMRGADGGPTWRATLPPLHYATHSLGALLFLTGDRCTTATGLSASGGVAPGSVGLEVGLFRTERGAVLKVLCGFSVERHPSFHWYVLYGTHGALESERKYDGVAGAGYAHEAAPGGAMRVRPMAPYVRGAAERRMLDAFIDCIVRDTRPPIDVYDAMDYTAPGICAHRSAERGGEPVQIPSYRRRAE